MRSILFWLCFPFVLPQAILLKRSLPRFVAPEGEKEGDLGSSERLRFLGLGDSIIAGVGAESMENSLVSKTARRVSEKFEKGVSWEAAGRIGATSSKVLDRMKLPKEPFDLILVSVGVNDVTALTKIGEWRSNLNELLTRLTQQSPNSQIAVLGLPPIDGFPVLPFPLNKVFGLRARHFTTIAEEVCSEFDQAVLVPLVFDPHPDQFSADGFHPNEDSFDEIAEEVVTYFE